MTSRAPIDAAPARVEIALDAYKGEFADDPRFSATFERLPALVARALARCERRLGLTALDPGRIRIVVEDIDPKRRGGDRARCYSCKGHDAGGHELGRHEIVLFTQYYLTGDSDLATTIDHELVHAVMRERMGPRRYHALPHWVREGLALWTADEGDRHIRRNLAVSEDVEALMTGLMERERKLVAYPYAYLSIEYLAKLVPNDGVRRFCRLIERGTLARDAMSHVTKRSWLAYRNGLREHAKARILGQARGLSDIRDAKSTYRRGAYEAALNELDAFLTAHGATAFAPTARFYRGRSLFELGRHAQAEAAFRAMIEQDLGRTGLYDEGVLYLGLSLSAQAKHEEAHAALRRYVTFHPYSSQVGRGYLALGRACLALDRRDAARDAFRLALSFPNTRPARARAAREALARLDADGQASSRESGDGDAP